MNRLLLQVWVFSFVALFGSELLAEEPILRAGVQLLYIGPIAAWAALALRGPRTLLDVAILSALTALAIAAWFGSDRQGGLESMGLATAYALAFWFLRDGIAAHTRMLLAIAGSYAFTGWVIMAAIYWILEKMAWLVGTGTLPGLESAQVFVWGTTNAFPILVMLAAGCLAWQPPSRVRSALVMALIVASVVAVPLSNGRAGWLGIAVAAVAWEGLGGWRHVRAGWRRLGHKQPMRPAAVAAAVVVPLTLVMAGPKLMGAIQEAFGDRFTIWGQALAIFAADPLTGGGPSTYAWLRLTHVPDQTYAVPVRLAHDVPLQTLADGGVLLAIAAVAVVWTFLAAARGGLSDHRRRVSVAVLIGIGSASLLDDFSSLPAVSVGCIALAAWSVAPRRRPKAHRSALRRWSLPIAMALLSVISLPAVIGSDVARIAAADGRYAAVAGDWRAAERAFVAATNAYPEQAAYWLGLGLALAEDGRTEAATDAYRKARELSPGDPRPYGALSSLVADPDARVALLEAAAARTTSDPQYAWRLAETLRELEATEDATNAYARAVMIEPQLIASLPAELRDAVLADLPGTAAEMALRNPSLQVGFALWDVGLAMGDLPRDADPAWRVVEAARAGDEAAVEAVFVELRSNGVAGIELNALAAVARYQCDLEAYLLLAEVLGEFRPGRLNEPTITRDHTYRDLGLGSYQPGPYALPADEPWPWSLVGQPPECPAWP
jgi:tetratricopeptide (TPR) repeat protein